MKPLEEIISNGPNSNVYLVLGKIYKEYYDEIARVLDARFVLSSQDNYSIKDYQKFLNLHKHDNYSEYKNHLVNLGILKKYHKIHNLLSKFDFILDSEDYIFYFDGNKIEKINIKILDLGNIKISKNKHIKTRKNVYITEPKPIISEYIYDNLEYNPSYGDGLYEYHSDDNSGYYLGKLIGQYFEYIGLVNYENPVSYCNNFTITGFDNGILEIVITDLGINITDFVKYQSKYIYDRISHNKGKSPDQYEPVPEKIEEAKFDIGR